MRVQKNVGPVPACKLHASWLADRAEGTSRGLRKGRYAARCALGDAVFGDMPPADLSPTGRFQHTFENCAAWYFSAESVPQPGNPKRRVFSRCCQHGRLADVPLLPPAPAMLAELLTGCIAESSTLTWHPCSQAGILKEHSLPAPRKRTQTEFVKDIRR